MRISEEEYTAILARQGKDKLQQTIRAHGFKEGKAPVKKSKYGNKKVTAADGSIFDSMGEHSRWVELCHMERAGKISDLQRQISYEIIPSVVLDGRKSPASKYTPDFQYIEDGVLVCEDFKNPATAQEQSFKLRRKLMKHVHGIEVKVTIKKTGGVK